MVNFTWEVKRELLTLPKARCCSVAEISALLTVSGGDTTEDRVEFISEHERIAELFMRLVERAFGVRMEVKEAVLDPKQRRDKLTLACTGESATRILLDTGIQTGDMSLFEARPCCAVSYLRGVFLGSGSCTIPQNNGSTTGYHLEFVFPNEELAESFCALLDSLSLFGKQVKRGEKRVVYLKSREAIADFFSVVGAKTALKRLENVSAAREERNNENRVENCYSGNADRTAIASATQFKAFGEMRENGVLQTLPTPLIQTAQARLNFPYLSLLELATKLGISKSCLNHRIRKLMQIYTQTEEEL